MAKTFEDYAEQLEKNLESARDAIIAGVDARMKACHAALRKFQEDSDDRITGVAELDEVAQNAMRDVTLARLDQSMVQNLSERSGEIANLIKRFSTQSAINSSAASALRLERVKALLDASTTAVDELKKFADTIDASTTDGKKLADALADAVSAVVKVQKQIVTT